MSEYTHQHSPLLVANQITGFLHFLRNNELSTSAGDAMLIGQALEDATLFGADTSLSIFRSIICRSSRDWVRFDALFHEYWLSSDSPHLSPKQHKEEPKQSHPKQDYQSQGAYSGSGMSTGTEQTQQLKNSDLDHPTGAGKQSSVAKADFRFLNDKAAMRQVERLTERLARNIRPKKGRRKEMVKSRGKLALGPTLRSSIRTAGMPMLPLFWKNKPDPPRLLILHDVSHSMTFNNPLLFRFTRGLVRHFKQAEAFVFHMRLYPVTRTLRRSSIRQVQETLEKNNRMWFGGTCIADSLAEFREKHAKHVIRHDSIAMIISDGIDSNQPEKLQQEIQFLKQKCKQVLWLNPMLERPGFNAQKESVQMIKQNVDFLMPAHSLDALSRCIKVVAK